MYRQSETIVQNPVNVMDQTDETQYRTVININVSWAFKAGEMCPQHSCNRKCSSDVPAVICPEERSGFWGKGLMLWAVDDLPQFCVMPLSCLWL